ncbi:MAG: MarR family transcriptional regulator [Terrisporobacter sp.]|uniref:MarR family winged helix-turn-helix transcriptional regulator n=1 Tax=Terrisporobacter sp. TaxID=1965305 RepID=UPI002FC5C0B6
MKDLNNKSKEFLNSIAKIKKLAHKQKKSNDFHPAMLMTLKTIWCNYEDNKLDENYCGMKTSDLTKDLCITKPATSKALNILEEKNYIERTSNKSDRRIVYVKLTSEGENFLKDQNKKFENFTCNIIEKMGEEDTDNLISLFGKLYDVIEELQSEK